MGEFRIKINKKTSNRSFIDKIKNIFCRRKKKEEQFSIIIKNNTTNENVENNNLANVNISDGLNFHITIKNRNINENAEISDLTVVTRPQEITVQDVNEIALQKSNPKKCPLCGTHESIYQRVVLKENNHWKCIICGHTW